jgi:hypothetical protein
MGRAEGYVVVADLGKWEGAYLKGAGRPISGYIGRNQPGGKGEGFAYYILLLSLAFWLCPFRLHLFGSAMLVIGYVVHYIAIMSTIRG